MKKTKKQKVLAEKRREALLTQTKVTPLSPPDQPSKLKLKDFFKEKNGIAPKQKGLPSLQTHEDYSYLKKDLAKITILSLSAFVIQLILFFILR